MSNAENLKLRKKNPEVIRTLAQLIRFSHFLLHCQFLRTQALRSTYLQNCPAMSQEIVGLVVNVRESIK